MVSTLFSIYFSSPKLVHKVKRNYVNVQTVNPVLCLIQFLRKASPVSLSYALCLRVLKKNISHVVLY